MPISVGVSRELRYSSRAAAFAPAPKDFGELSRAAFGAPVADEEKGGRFGESAPLKEALGGRIGLRISELRTLPDLILRQCAFRRPHSAFQGMIKQAKLFSEKSSQKNKILMDSSAAAVSPINRRKSAKMLGR